MDESAAIHKALPAVHTKNLFLKDKQGKFWLVTLPSDRRADLKAIAAGEVIVVFGAAFRAAERIAVHPLRNTATIALPFAALETWLSGRGVETQVVALP